MIDYDKFRYRVGDKVRRMVYSPEEVQPAEYEIIGIEEAKGFGRTYRRNSSSTGDSGYRHYRLKNLSPGCLDQPQWVSQNIVHSQYEPSNPAVKLLFNKPRPEFEAKLGIFADHVHLDPKTLTIMRDLFNSTKLTMINTPRRAGKSWLYQQFQENEANRAGEQSDPHSLDALRYAVQGKPSKKVSR